VAQTLSYTTAVCGLVTCDLYAAASDSVKWTTVTTRQFVCHPVMSRRELISLAPCVCGAETRYRLSKKASSLRKVYEETGAKRQFG